MFMAWRQKKDSIFIRYSTDLALLHEDVSRLPPDYLADDGGTTLPLFELLITWSSFHTFKGNIDTAQRTRPF